jgi:DNA-binding MarR family transcriptional regulator
MEKSGLIQKVPDENDLRCNIIRFAEKGKKLVDNGTSICNSIDRKMYVGFTEKEKAQLKQFYIRIIQNLENGGIHNPTQ